MRRAAKIRTWVDYLDKLRAGAEVIQFKAVLDTVHEDVDVAIISRRGGADAVVMSPEHYQRLMRTLHLMASPVNAAHLAKSIAQHKAGKVARRGWSNSIF